MVLRLLFAPISGITWIAEQIHERAIAELNDKENLQKRLLALQLAFDMGDISEADFEQQEEELLLAIQAMEDAEAAEAAAVEATFEPATEVAPEPPATDTAETMSDSDTDTEAADPEAPM